MKLNWHSVGKSKVPTKATVGSWVIFIGVIYGYKRTKLWSWIIWDYSTDEYTLVEQSRRLNKTFDTDGEARLDVERWLVTPK